MEEKKESVLHLTLKKKWFDMFLNGIKKEEYREIKDYWVRRFVENKDEMESSVFQELISDLKNLKKHHSNLDELLKFFDCKIKHFDYVVFRNGYKKDAPQLIASVEKITIQEANPDWSDNAEGLFFCIKIKDVNPNKKK